MSSSKQQGHLIVLLSPSGGGKSTIIARLKKDFPELHESISFTTRPPREGDIHGVQYFFVDKEEFIRRRDMGEFVEWAAVHNNFYGTSRLFIEDQIKLGHIILLDIDVQGTDRLKQLFPDTTTAIFIAPPSLNALKERLIKRGKDSLETIEVRLKTAEKEMVRQHDYDHLIINDDLERAYAELRQIVASIVATSRCD